MNWIDNRPESQCERVVTSRGIPSPPESAPLIVFPARFVAADVGLAGRTVIDSGGKEIYLSDFLTVNDMHYQPEREPGTIMAYRVILQA